MTMPIQQLRARCDCAGTTYVVLHETLKLYISLVAFIARDLSYISITCYFEYKLSYA
jgi:hypothetical protein